MLTLGLNIDHVATLRQARRDVVPDVLQAAFEGIRGGAKGITVHLREDRRHIQDADVFLLKKKIKVPLNLEMSVSDSIVKIALKVKPEKVCLVPEKRQELTTEGGLDVLRDQARISRTVSKLRKSGIVVSLFIDPEPNQILAAAVAHADYVEFHTGVYARAKGKIRGRELRRLREAAIFAHQLSIGVNAGHGLNYDNVKSVAKLPFMEELNIGHAIVARSVFVGLKNAVREMVKLIS